METVRLGVRIPVVEHDEANSGIAIADLSRFAARCEEVGIDALFVAPTSQIDPYVALGACAGVTSRILLGCCPHPDDDRPPSLIAKVVTSLDVISNGRAIGIFGASQERDDITDGRLSESLEIVRAMVRIPGASFTGEHYAITGAWNEPRAPHDDAMPLGFYLDHIPEVVPRRGVSIVDLGAQFCEYFIMRVDERHDLKFTTVMQELASRFRRAGRQRSSINLLGLITSNDGRSLSAWSDRASSLISAGFDGVVIDGTQADDLLAHAHELRQTFRPLTAS